MILTRVLHLVVPLALCALSACRGQDASENPPDPVARTVRTEPTEAARARQDALAQEQVRELEAWASGFLGKKTEHLGGFGAIGVALGRPVSEVEKQVGVSAAWMGPVAELKVAGPGGEGVQFTFYTAASSGRPGPRDDAGASDAIATSPVIRAIRFALPFKGRAQRDALFTAIEGRFGEAWTQHRVQEHHNTPAFELDLYRFEHQPNVVVAEASDWLFEIFLRADDSVPLQGLSTTAGPTSLPQTP